MNKSKNVILIKLGGSIITDKSTPKTANIHKIRQLSYELHQAREQTNAHIILGHGGGSFPHQSAAKYQTIEGIKNEASLLGMAQVRFDASELNQIVTSHLIDAGEPAFTLAPSTFFTTKNRKVNTVFYDSLLNLLKTSMLPVIYGDVVTDEEIGCTIYSTEQILNEFAMSLPEYNLEPKLIIEIGKTDGVYDGSGATIPHINKENFESIKHLLKSSESTDVTGGMLHKVQEAYDLAKFGVPTLLISSEPGNLKKAILGQPLTGTWIK